MNNENKFDQEEKIDNGTLINEVNQGGELELKAETISENTREEEMEALNLGLENKKSSKDFFSYYLPINLVDGVFSALIATAIAIITMFVLRIMGYAIVKEYVTEFILALFIIIFIFYKSYGPISKKGCTVGERVVK